MAAGDEHRHAADERERQATAAHPAADGACGYPSGDEDRDSVIELLCDEWPMHLGNGFLEWEERLRVVLHLLGVLDHKRLTIIDLGDPVTAEDLRQVIRSREEGVGLSTADAVRASEGSSDPTSEPLPPRPFASIRPAVSTADRLSCTVANCPVCES